VLGFGRKHEVPQCISDRGHVYQVTNQSVVLGMLRWIGLGPQLQPRGTGISVALRLHLTDIIRIH